MHSVYTFNWQTFERNYIATKSLLVKAGAHTDTGRINTLILNYMFYVTLNSIDQSSDNSNIVIDFAGTIPGGTNFSAAIITVPLTGSNTTLSQAIRAALVTWSNTTLGTSITDNDLVITGIGSDGILARSFSSPSLAVNTSRQPSTTRDTMVNASVDITSTISLTTGQNGKVALQYADNTGFTTNVVTVQSATNGNTGSLTIGLNLSQVYTAALTGIVPANKYYRLVTTNVTGTPTYGTPVIQEVLL